MLINLRKHKAIIAKNAERCREKGIILPTFAQMKDPALIPDDIKERLIKLETPKDMANALSEQANDIRNKIKNLQDSL